MTKDKAGEIASKAVYASVNTKDQIQLMAEALLTAHEEGRKKGLEEAMDRVCQHKLGKQRIGTRHSFCCEHRAEIRQLLGGENPDLLGEKK